MKTIISVVLFAGVCFANPLTSRATCTLAGQTVTDPASCSLLYRDPNSQFGGQTNVNAYAVFSMSSLDAPVTSFSASLSVSGAVMSYNSYVSANVDASAGWSVNAISTGPQRQGYLFLTLYQQSSWSSHSNSDGEGSAQIGQYNYAAGYFPGCDNCFTVTLPFTLGTPFVIGIGGDAGADSYMGGGFAEWTDQMSFSLFEADGVTPVAFQATPEPATFLSIAFGISGIAAKRWGKK